MSGVRRTRPRELSDALWARAQPLLPESTPHRKGGRPRRDDREMLGAILYVLRTGIQWNALPRAIGASTTVYDRFRAWERDGFFTRLWAAGLSEFDELVGSDWAWLSMDGAMTKAPFAQAATAQAATAQAEGIGRTPTDRGKPGTKRSLLSEGHGLPLAVAIAGAHRTDMKLVVATLDALVIDRPPPTDDQPQGVCLDKGYDYDQVRDHLDARGYPPYPSGGRGARLCPQSRSDQGSAALGGRAPAQLAQPLAAAGDPLRTLEAHLHGVCPFGLRPHLLSAM